MDIKSKILKIIENISYKPSAFKEMVNLLELKEKDEGLLADALNELEAEGVLVKTSKGKYLTPVMANMAVGTIQINERGFGFVVCENYDKDIFIAARNVNGAINQDKVLVKLKKTSSYDRRPEGEIINIINRANSKIIGTFKRNKYFGFVIPDDKRVNMDVFIPKAYFNGAVEGSKVIAEIVNWPQHRKNAEGKIIEVFGAVGEAGIDIISIAKAYNIQAEFPSDVLEEAEIIPNEVRDTEIDNRRDLRDLRIVTIDGEDAKDLDDAVSIEKRDDGSYILGVHIADVSYYVKEEGPLDKEANKRGTSVYLVDRVIPMLPKELSNGICSLNAGVDRLAFSVIMEIDKAGDVINHEIFKSVIRVNERMTYTDVTKILVDENAKLLKRYEKHVKDFKLMQELSEILMKRRVQRGSIDFDFPETKIILDEKGKPIEIKKYEITISNKIIEEFMLVCNETIAERMFWANAPFVYRIHEKPDTEKIEGFNEFLHGIGYSVKGINNLHPRALQEVMEKVKGKGEEKVVATLMLRSLQQAKYYHKNEGHFGLAAKYYCHFTSPIRRYPDLFIHRVIGELVTNNFVLEEKRYNKLSKFAVETARISTETEKMAEQAEREVEELKKVEFMADRLGEVFKAVISSVTSFGFFVELDNLIEGLVHVDSLQDDYYIFDSKRYCLVGEHKKKIFKIGQELNVRLAKADVTSKRLDFVIEDEDENCNRKGKKVKYSKRKS